LFSTTKATTVLVLPMIPVQNQIRNMLGGKTGKITFGRIKYKFRISSNNNSAMCTIYRYIMRVRTSRSLVLGLWVCHAQRFGLLLAEICDLITAVTLYKPKHSLKLSAYTNRTAVLWLIRDVAVKLAQTGFEDNSWLTRVRASWKGYT